MFDLAVATETQPEAFLARFSVETYESSTAPQPKKIFFFLNLTGPQVTGGHMTLTHTSAMTYIDFRAGSHTPTHTYIQITAWTLPPKKTKKSVEAEGGPIGGEWGSAGGRGMPAR